jgi:hypothetical protein
VQGYPIWDLGDCYLKFNQDSKRGAIDFAYDAKAHHPESEVTIHILNEAPKEENMDAEQIQSTVIVTDAEVKAAAEKIQHDLNEWESGRMCSPDQRDYVIDCCEVLNVDHANYVDIVQEIADEIYEDMGEELLSVEAIAKYALTRLREYDVQPEHGDAAKQEFLVHLNIQTLRERGFVDVETVQREIQGALEVGLGSDHTPSLQGAEVVIALAEEI